MVRMVMDIFINQNASKFFIDFLLCVLLKSGTRGFFVLARVCSYCAGVNIYRKAERQRLWVTMGWSMNFDASQDIVSQ